jgi:hypothetical protein
MNGLRAYFDKNGTEHDGCCGEWPVHSRCAPEVPTYVAPTAETTGSQTAVTLLS